MTRTMLGLTAACVVALFATVAMPASAQTGKAEIVTSGAMQPTAAKKPAKKAAKAKAKKAAAKSCGTYKYPDKKTGKCVDARDKKK